MNYNVQQTPDDVLFYILFTVRNLKNVALESFVSHQINDLVIWALFGPPYTNPQKWILFSWILWWTLRTERNEDYEARGGVAVRTSIYGRPWNSSIYHQCFRWENVHNSRVSNWRRVNGWFSTAHLHAVIYNRHAFTANTFYSSTNNSIIKILFVLKVQHRPSYKVHNNISRWSSN